MFQGRAGPVRSDTSYGPVRSSYEFGRRKVSARVGLYGDTDKSLALRGPSSRLANQSGLLVAKDEKHNARQQDDEHEHDKE